MNPKIINPLAVSAWKVAREAVNLESMARKEWDDIKEGGDIEADAAGDRRGAAVDLLHRARALACVFPLVLPEPPRESQVYPVSAGRTMKQALEAFARWIDPGEHLEWDIALDLQMRGQVAVVKLGILSRHENPSLAGDERMTSREMKDWTAGRHSAARVAIEIAKKDPLDRVLKASGLPPADYKDIETRTLDGEHAGRAAKYSGLLFYHAWHVEEKT